MNNRIEIKNARIHSLKGVDVSIPKHKLTVITGVSGSGKSSLAFDTLYEEGKRRYLMFSGTELMVDTVSNFDSITGLSPTVAVEQRIIRQSNPRSTVGTKIKISAMLAALFANYGSRLPEYDDGLPFDISMFRKNSPKGMCVKCLGKGMVKQIDAEKIFHDRKQHIYEIACELGKRSSTRNMLEEFCKKHGMNLWEDKLVDLTEEQIDLLKYGDGGKSKFYGFIPWITMLTNGSVSTSGRLAYLLKNAGMIEERKCAKCNGTGLGEQAAHTTFGGKTINELENMYISDLLEFLKGNYDEKNPLIKEIITKLLCMVEVGLHHLSLSRPVPSLSGGEIQRLFLASYIITEMDSIIFVFDEPTIGLHEIEKEKLIGIIRRLRDNGNTVVVVEHDENFIRQADYIIDMGPNAGIYGGMKIYEGGYKEFLKCTNSKTAPYLSKKLGFKIKKEYRKINREKMLTMSGARLHNLKNVTVQIPLGVMVGVAGVSGSGKSSLISDTLVPKLKEQLKSKCVMDEEVYNNSEEDTEEAEKDNTEVTLTGADNIKHCYIIDQRPIGRSKTSCPATYTGIFDRVRNLFADSEKARELGYTAGMFSVNSKGGCYKCKGDGVIHYHVGFGSFIDIDCDECGGSGYVREAMEIDIDGKNIRDVLEMSVDEAKEFFAHKDKTIYTMLNILQRVGMGYIKLGQSTPTISGGESQRIKLAKELSRGRSSKGALYILDEPTTGLSFSDSEQLMSLLNELVDMGNSIIITEHDSHILSNCDYIIELGEGGGNEGGNIIAVGTPAELKNNQDSIIGRYLK